MLARFCFQLFAGAIVIRLGDDLVVDAGNDVFNNFALDWRRGSGGPGGLGAVGLGPRRERAEAEDLSIRELVIAMTNRQSFIGSPRTVADALHAHVQARACDGFILIPHVTPGGLDRFADEVVPLLQERGSFRAEYAGTTLREHFGVPRPAGDAGPQPVRAGATIAR